MVFIDKLPPGASLWNEIGGDAAWTTSEHLLANVLDTLNAANWQRGGGKAGDRPKPVQRPADLLKKRKQTAKIEEHIKRFKKGNMPVIVPGPEAEDD